MKYIIILLTFLSSLAHSTLYSDHEIEQFLYQQNNKNSGLVNKILTDQLPLISIKEWIHSKGHSDIEKEFQLFALLDQLALLPPDNHFSPLLKKLSEHQPLTFKNHPEGKYHGHAPIALFDISTKAKGVTNIWTAKNVQNQASHIISSETNTLEALALLLKNRPGHSRPVQLGIKNAIQASTNSQLEHLKQAYYAQKTIPEVLQSSLSNVVMASNDLGFALWALENMNKEHSELTYRLIAQNFPQELCLDILTSPIKNQANPNFVVTLLTPYISHPKAAAYLLEQLNNKSTSKGAAYALSKSDDSLVWKEMERIYNTTASDDTKKSIQFSLQQNKNDAAQLVFNRMKRGGDQQ